MPVSVTGTGITFANGTVQTTAATAGISAQNCSYTGSLVEGGPIVLSSGTYQQTADMGSNRVMTGLRRIYDGCNNQYLYLRGYNIKNTA